MLARMETLKQPDSSYYNKLTREEQEAVDALAAPLHCAHEEDPAYPSLSQRRENYARGYIEQMDYIYDIVQSQLNAQRKLYRSQSRGNDGSSANGAFVRAILEAVPARVGKNFSSYQQFIEMQERGGALTRN